MKKALQELFVESRGCSIERDGHTIVQADTLPIRGHFRVRLEFVGSRVFTNNAVVLWARKPDFILLSDGGKSQAVAIWDEEGLPRSIEYECVIENGSLRVHNKYRVFHRADFVTEDNFTGNAGMIVTELTPTRRRHECSVGPGEFDPGAFVFEIAW